MVLAAFLALTIGCLVAAVAVPCARLGAFAIYLKVVSAAVVVAVLGFVLIAYSIPPHGITLQLVALYAALFVPLGLLYALSPGLLVRQGAPSRSILVATSVTSAVGVPIWYYYCLLLVCWRGDC
jgi:hypothetical protein